MTRAAHYRDPADAEQPYCLVHRRPTKLPKVLVDDWKDVTCFDCGYRWRKENTGARSPALGLVALRWQELGELVLLFAKDGRIDADGMITYVERLVRDTALARPGEVVQ